MFDDSPTPTNESLSTQLSSSEQIAPGKLELLESKSESSEYSRSIVGKVINNSSKNYGYVQITFKLYDKAGNVVGSTMANMNNLAPGETWKFNAPVFEDNTASYKASELTGF
jgi:hypothetical protein